MKRTIRKRAQAVLLIFCLFLSGCRRQNMEPVQKKVQQEVEQNDILHTQEKNGTDIQEYGADTQPSLPSEEDEPRSSPSPSNGQNDSENSASSYSELSSPSTAGPLQVSGTQLTDSSGNPVQLRGISTHGLAWFPDYINEDCFAELRSGWNANVVRLAMYTAESGGYCTDGDPSYLKDLIRNGVKYAGRQDMYVIIDWHILSDNNPNTYLDEAKAFFHELSEEFSQETHVLYEICNEPNGQTSWNDIKNYALNVIPVIRANDPDAIIIIGTPNWSQWVDQAAEDPITEYDNLMYALHFYAATHKEDLRSKLETALSAGLPVFVSEYGICDASGNGALDLEEANRWIAALDQYNVSYIAWNLSNKNESSAVLKPSCEKNCNFAPEDLSDSGQWLYQMLNRLSAEDFVSNDSVPNVPAPNPPENSFLQENSHAHTSLEVTATLTGSWDNNGIPYYQYSLTLKNTSDQPLNSWKVDLTFSDTPTLSDGWNGNYTVEGKVMHITSMEYNGSIPPGGTINDIGFIVSNADIIL